MREIAIKSPDVVIKNEDFPASFHPQKGKIATVDPNCQSVNVLAAHWKKFSDTLNYS